MYLSIPLENVLFHDNEQPALYASPDVTRDRHDNSVEAFHLLLAMHATSICEPLLKFVRDALQSSIYEDEYLYDADAELCRFLRAKGICLADARGWLYEIL